MPRTTRKKAFTKVYHVIIRGINKQDIFLDKLDRIKFIKEITNTKEKYDYELYAYALMNDHVHFVIYDKNNNISIAIQSLNVRYCSYFNKKYERTGHLFENRFKSKSIEDVCYLKTVIRYIHKNPENAGLEPYSWTSYSEYMKNPKLINPDRVLRVFGDDVHQALNTFEIFHEEYKKYRDFTQGLELLTKISDDEAIKIIKKVVNEDNLINIQNYDKEKKYKTINRVLQIEGITKKQLARILGINRKTISRIEKYIKDIDVPKGTDAPFGNVPNGTPKRSRR